MLVCKVGISPDHAKSWKGREPWWSALLQRSFSLQELRLQECCKDTTFILLLVLRAGMAWCGHVWYQLSLEKTIHVLPISLSTIPATYAALPGFDFYFLSSAIPTNQSNGPSFLVSLSDGHERMCVSQSMTLPWLDGCCCPMMGWDHWSVPPALLAPFASENLPCSRRLFGLLATSTVLFHITRIFGAVAASKEVV